jgi:hypothetical protein
MDLPGTSTNQSPPLRRLEGPSTHIRTSQLEAQKNVRTVRTGAHPVPTAPSHFGAHHHLPSHQLPPNSPPASPNPLHPPEISPIPQQHHFESQLGSELISLIKATSEALRSIAQVAERLIRRVNTERRLAHKSQRTLGVRVRTRVETQCALSPLRFLLGGGYL